MTTRCVTFACLVAATWVAATHAESSTYPPLKEYLMPRDAEIALARTAAPANISSSATVKVLTSSG